MKNTDSLLEALEPRIAPATLIAGGTGKDFSAPEFVATTASSANAAISSFFGPSSTGNYYITLNPGDIIRFDHDNDASTPAQDWFQLKGGKAIAFFLDDGDGQIEKNELTGLSLGGAASISINGDVSGDILTNLDAKGSFLGNTLGDPSKSFITDLNVAGSINGNVLSGGNILKLTAGSFTGEHGIFAGTAASGIDFSLGGKTTVGAGNSLFDPAKVKAGASISNVTINDDIDTICSGDGNSTGAGGSISGITIRGNIKTITAGNNFENGTGGNVADIVIYGDTYTIAAGFGGGNSAGGNISNIKLLAEKNDLLIYAGNGGTGTEANGHGGSGGKISGVEIQSASNTGSGGGGIDIQAGEGGGEGGGGGSVEKVTIGALYDAKTKSWQPCAEEFHCKQAVQIQGGAGGMGGNGGSVANIAVFTENSGIKIIGGDGGPLAGNGGSLSNIFAISNFSEDNGGTNSSVHLTAGNAQETSGTSGSGGNGGSITNILGVGAATLNITAGNGASGANGGNGGSILSVIANTTLTRVGTIEISAGNGGHGGEDSGRGGNGGTVDKVQIGAVFSAETKTWVPLSRDLLPSSAVLTGGNGGDGSTGGTGGSVTNAKLMALDGLAGITSGSGGASYYSRGGNGGEINNILAISLSALDPSSAKVQISTGTGGDGATLGGSGGTVKNISMGGYTAEITSGRGGWGDYAGGNGGSISNIDANTPLTPTLWLGIAAGNGGEGGWKVGGSGGSISGISASNSKYLAQTTEPLEEWQEAGFNLILKAGDGGNGFLTGGNGGALSNNQFQITSLPGSTNPSSGVEWLIAAGEGGEAYDDWATGGKGGNITSCSFQDSTKNDLGLFLLTAGGGGEGTIGGSGGALNNVSAVIGTNVQNINNAPYAGAIFHAGEGGPGWIGGKGGTVQGCSVQSKSFVTILGGNGGYYYDSDYRGGDGGSIQSSTFSGSGLHIIAGTGGEGNEEHGTGGSISKLSASFGADGLFLNAGSGSGGGSVQSLKLVSQEGGTLDIWAGNATGGLKASQGGSVRDIEIQYWLENSHNISILSGYGYMGGNGGDIENIRDKVLTSTQDLTPSKCNITLYAGWGLDAEKTGGHGGSINSIKFVAPGEGYQFNFTAGEGGPSEGKGGNGGSVTGITLLSQATVIQRTFVGDKQIDQSFKGTFAEGVALGTVDIFTGNGADSGTATLGGKGGDAKSIAWNIDGLVRSLTLGTGGIGTSSSGADGKAIAVNPDPNVPAPESSAGSTTVASGTLTIMGGYSGTLFTVGGVGEATPDESGTFVLL